MKISNPYREASVTVENRVEENQYRVGPTGMIFVHSARGKIDDRTIHHAPKESGVIFGISQILVKGKESGFESPSICDTWQYHTISSIEEKWPKVLSPNWLQDLING